MSAQVPAPATLSQKKLSGIYWKTFMGFVNKDEERNMGTHRRPEKPKLQRREGSFEYMELTTKDNGSEKSESDSSSSAENSLAETTKEDRANAMYAVLDMSTKKEIKINDEIAIFEGSPLRSLACDHQSNLTLVDLPPSPKCSPIPRVDVLLVHDVATPSPVSRAAEASDKDEAIFADKDDIQCGDESFDRLESTSPSMEPAPWKADHGASIQRWMVPHILQDDDDEFVAVPSIANAPPECFEYCHYVPTLEAILEESEECSEAMPEPRSRLSKSASFSDSTELKKCSDRTRIAKATSADDLLVNYGQSQDDLFSITSTFGSLVSMRRLSTFENLSFDEDQGEDSDGSSDELDRIDGCELAHQEGVVEESSNTTFEAQQSEFIEGLSVELFPTVPDSEETLSEYDNLDDETKLNSEFLTVPNAASDLSSDTSASPYKIESSREAIATSSAQSLDECDMQSSGRGSPPNEIAEEPIRTEVSVTRSSSSSNLRRDSGVDDVISEPPNDVRNSKDYDETTASKINIPGLPEELYFDSRDIPKIVVMFAQEEIEKERKAKEKALMEGELDDPIAGEYVQHRRRSMTYDSEQHDSAYSSREGVQRRVHQIKSNDASRLSTLSNSTPELSAMGDDALLYIPVSYASEAAAARKKKKRRATMSAAETSNRTRATAKSLQTKVMISGTGFGNGFSSLRKKLKSRKTIGLRRSQSEKPQVSHSDPDVSGPMARFLNSPRRWSKKSTDSPPKAEGRRRGFRSVVSNIFRRLSSRFSTHNRPPTRDVRRRDVIEEEDHPNSPCKSNLGIVKEEPSSCDSVSIYSNQRDRHTPSVAESSVVSSPNRCNSVLDVNNPNCDAGYIRQRSFSLPVRPNSESPSMKYASTESDVFESLQSTDSGSLDKTIYV